MKLKQTSFWCNFGRAQKPQKIVSHFLSYMIPQLSARNQNTPTTVSGGKLRTHGQTDERTNVRRVFHGTFTSSPKSSKKLTWLRRNYQELDLSLIISNFNYISKSQIKSANYTNKSQAKCDRNFAFLVLQSSFCCHFTFV